MLEWFGFVLGLAGVGFGLLALPEKFGKWQGHLFDAGLVVLLVCGILILWPLLKKIIAAIRAHRAPVSLGMLYEVAVESRALGGPDEVADRFMALIVSLAQRGSLQLLGRRGGNDNVPIPPEHLDEYVLMKMPALAGRGYVFRTIKPDDFPTNPSDPGAYYRLHVPRRARDVYLAALAAAMPPPAAATAIM